MKTPEDSTSATVKLALTRKQAAVALGVSPMTIDRLTQQGILNPSRATRRPLFALTELERFLRDTTSQPQTLSKPSPRVRRNRGVDKQKQQERQPHGVTGARLPHSATGQPGGQITNSLPVQPFSNQE